MNPEATVQQICQAIGAECPEVPATVVAGVSTDTRTLRDGDLFVALKGDRFDGHGYVGEALRAGAVAVVVEDAVEDAVEVGGVPVLRVGDTLMALQRLALWHRRRLGLVAIGITGSNGKTSTKDFTAAVLRRKLQVTATKGNLNNHIGLPLSVLAADAGDEAAVWELGMNHAGEIAPLCQIAEPSIGIITNIGSAHIEYLGSREGIAEEKSALARALPEDGTLVVPAGCDFVEYFRERTRAKVLPVGNGRGLVRAEDLDLSSGAARFTLVIEGHESAEVRLAVDGRHMVSNALLAAGVASELGLDAAEIAAGLESARLTGGRLTRLQRNGVEILDDSYNANPESMVAAIETLVESPVADGGKRIAVLGFMAELGAFAEESHQRIGRLAAGRGVGVVSVGRSAQAIAEAATAAGGAGEHFDLHEDAAAWLAAAVQPGDVVLFKGSRTAAVERVLQAAFPEETD